MNKMISSFQKVLNRVLDAQYSRKEFLRLLGVTLGALLFSSRKSRIALAASGVKLKERQIRAVTTACGLAAAKSDSPSKAARKAVETLGGMSRFVRKGDVVVVKPNIGWDRSPDQAGNTNPEVVGEIVKMAVESGAKIVKVFDNTCANAQRTYKTSGIADAAKKAGATVYNVSDWKFFPGIFPQGASMEDWPIFRDAVECDCFINVPVAKHHGLTELTLSIKNLMGVCGGRRGIMHLDITQKLAELVKFIKPDLTVIDAYRILLRHGPTGGDLKDVEMKKTVIASADPVLADAYAATLFGMQPADIGYIKRACELGAGKMDLSKADIKLIEA